VHARAAPCAVAGKKEKGAMKKPMARSAGMDRRASFAVLTASCAATATCWGVARKRQLLARETVA